MTLKDDELNATECFLNAIKHTPGGPAASADAHLKLARVLIEDALKHFAKAETTRKQTIGVVQTAAREAGSSVYAKADLAVHEAGVHDDLFVSAKRFEQRAEETLRTVLAVLDEGTQAHTQGKGMLGILHSQRSRRRARTGCTTGDWC